MTGQQHRWTVDAAPGTSTAQRCGAGPGDWPGISADERAWQFSDVTCARCGAIVQVAKFSPEHTSVQWTALAVGACLEFSAAAAEGTQSALVATCASLRWSIDAAVRDGAVQVLPP